MKKKILIIIGVLLAFSFPFLFCLADYLAELTKLPQKAFECASVVALWAALIVFVASNDKNTCRRDTD